MHLNNKIVIYILLIFVIMVLLEGVMPGFIIGRFSCVGAKAKVVQQEGLVDLTTRLLREYREIYGAYPESGNDITNIVSYRRIQKKTQDDMTKYLQFTNINITYSKIIVLACYVDEDGYVVAVTDTGETIKVKKKSIGD